MDARRRFPAPGRHRHGQAQQGQRPRRIGDIDRQFAIRQAGPGRYRPRAINETVIGHHQQGGAQLHPLALIGAQFDIDFQFMAAEQGAPAGPDHGRPFAEAPAPAGPVPVQHHPGIEAEHGGMEEARAIDGGDIDGRDHAPGHGLGGIDRVLGQANVPCGQIHRAEGQDAQGDRGAAQHVQGAVQAAVAAADDQGIGPCGDRLAQGGLHVARFHRRHIHRVAGMGKGIADTGRNGIAIALRQGAGLFIHHHRDPHALSSML